MGVEPDEVVYLDDLGINLKPAAAMGMTTIKVVDHAEALRQLEAAVGFPVGPPLSPESAGPARPEDVISDELIEVEERQTLSREAAAARLRQLADQLARHNQIEFVREGVRYTVRVPDEVNLKIEVEIGDESEIEFELTW